MEGESPSEKGYLPLFVDGLPQSYIDKFAPNLEELEKDVQKDITRLRKYTESQNYPFFDDNFYLSYLRVSKYNYKKAKSKLKHYFYNRFEKFSDLYKNYLDPDVIRTVLEKSMVGVLPYRDEDGNAILYTRGDAWSEDICDFKYFALTLMITVELTTRIPLTSITGAKYLADVSAKQFSYFYVFQKAVVSYHSAVKGFPFHFKQINIVKDNTLCRQLYYLVRPLLPKKLTQRVEMHGDNLQSLHSYINPDILPSEYGGKIGPVDNKHLIEKVMEYLDTFKEEQLIYDNASENQ